MSGVGYHSEDGVTFTRHEYATLPIVFKPLPLPLISGRPRLLAVANRRRGRRLLRKLGLAPHHERSAAEMWAAMMEYEMKAGL